ncbi:PKD domain-containing protein, partial [Candidatus Amoebophilus asiaticus]|nr:PKD domain-containing protein [Candidatus Amoebophilus asiaticus]
MHQPNLPLGFNSKRIEFVAIPISYDSKTIQSLIQIFFMFLLGLSLLLFSNKIFAQCAANFTFSTDTTLTASFMDGSTGAMTWYWEFGDSIGTSTQQNPIYTYGVNGTYTVKLVITDGSMCSDSMFQTLTVPGGGAAHCSNGIMDADETGIDCGGIDCTPCGAPHCTNGVMDADETGIDCGGIDCPPCGGNCYAEFSFFTDTTYTASFTDASMDAFFWYWDFGDATNSTLQNPSHTYSFADTFYVCLEIKDSLQACSSLVCKPVIVPADTGGTPHCSNGMMDADETGIDCGGMDCPPCGGNCYADFSFFTDTTYTASFADASFDASFWYWDFGDATSSTLPNPSHTYSFADTFNVCLQIKDSLQACSSFVCKPVIVPADTGGTPHCSNGIMDADETGIDCGGIDCVPCNTGNCWADFGFNTDSTLTASFFDNSSNAYYWEWDFDSDGISDANVPNATYTYPIQGQYIACLVIHDSAMTCTDTICYLIEVPYTG